MCVYDILVVLTTLHFCVIIPRASAAFYYAQRATGKNTKTNYTEIQKKNVCMRTAQRKPVLKLTYCTPYAAVAVFFFFKKERK